ncbi:uncharacterized protein LOC143195870 [Rhynchophorus ferrugineus]|uniref:uncharacterized protein LOC143195870 n=1 Tax=Rhynchophorus ferrugineus TaxID=354439 RepID=UPI003FCDF6BE
MSDMKDYWFNKKCCVPDCTNCSTMGEGCFKEYFDLPAELRARTRWLKAILAEDGDNLKVCEDHFDEHDIFLDKSNKKKLKINSTPSVLLPQVKCYDVISTEKQSVRMSSPATQSLNNKRFPVSKVSVPEKCTRRSRLSWSREERTILFRLIKKYGETKFSNNHIRINWKIVCEQSRNYDIFASEKDLKSAWQYLRVRAVKVANNEFLGTKLDKKVAKYIAHLKGTPIFVTSDSDTSDDEFQEIPLNDNREKADTRNGSLSEKLNFIENDKTLSNDIQTSKNMDMAVEEDEIKNNNETLKNTMNINETMKARVRRDEAMTETTKDEPIRNDINDNKKVESWQKSEIVCEESVKDTERKNYELNNSDTNMILENDSDNQKHPLDDTKLYKSELQKEEVGQSSGQETDSDDEYYSLADVERKYGIKIKHEPEVISLLSSDESDCE